MSPCIPTPLSDFARNMLGDEFCLNCYKDALGLADASQAQEARALLVLEGVFTLDQGRCENMLRLKANGPCRWKGLVIKLKQSSQSQ